MRHCWAWWCHPGQCVCADVSPWESLSLWPCFLHIHERILSFLQILEQNVRKSRLLEHLRVQLSHLQFMITISVIRHHYWNIVHHRRRSSLDHRKESVQWRVRCWQCVWKPVPCVGPSLVREYEWMAWLSKSTLAMKSNCLVGLNTRCTNLIC